MPRILLCKDMCFWLDEAKVLCGCELELEFYEWRCSDVEQLLLEDLLPEAIYVCFKFGRGWAGCVD